MSIWITALAMAVALGCAFYAWWVSRAENLRSEARVTALAAAIEGTASGSHMDADRRESATEMFGRDPRSVVEGRPLLKVAIGFGMAVAIIVLIAMSGDRHEAPDTAAAAEQVTAEALELLSMRHERAGTTLKVTGLVRNPGPAAQSDIIAVVFAFDRDGGFVASGRAPLEFGTISAGDESPFQVTIPDVKQVGRYRVSFRTNAGAVRHVDRRQPSSGEIAQRSAGTSL